MLSLSSTPHKTAALKAQENLNLIDFKEMQDFLPYVKSTMDILKLETFYAISNSLDDHLRFNKIILIVYLVLVWILLITGWRTMFKTLSRESKWVNGFIVLIPLKLIRENQHLKIWLKKKIKMKSLANF